MKCYGGAWNSYVGQGNRFVGFGNVMTRSCTKCMAWYSKPPTLPGGPGEMRAYARNLTLPNPPAPFPTREGGEEREEKADAE